VCCFFPGLGSGGVATLRASDLEDGNAFDVGGLVLLPFLLLRVLRDGTLCGFVLSILWALIVRTLFDREEAIGTVTGLHRQEVV